jgi:hypothetical protein
MAFRIYTNLAILITQLAGLLRLEDAMALVYLFGGIECVSQFIETGWPSH